MRLTLWGIALLLFGMIAGVLLGHGAIRYQQAQVQRELRDAGMSRKVAKVDFRRTTFEQAVEQLHHQTKANLAVNWQTLEAAGIDRHAPVTLQVDNISLRRVLDLVCQQAAADSTRLAARVDGGVIVISTLEELSRQTVTRMYDVRDLIVADHDLRSRIERLLKKVSAGYESDQPTDEKSLSRAQADSVESLIKAIQAIVEPDSWRDAGGIVGTVREFGGRLIIVQSPEAHDKIADLLEQLRDS
ncbi:MAG TPA: hypothetical protein VF669_02950 [Tepidisphaeraceae bacterium]|jgi:hypothetical protein